MQWRPNRLMILCFAAAAALAACSGGRDLPDPAPAARGEAETAISAAPWLRARLPENTIAYVRVPGPWAFLAAPNGKAADAMFASRGHVAAVQRIRDGLASNPVLAEVLQSDAVDRYLRALNTIAAPIEFAVVDPGRSATPAAQVLVSTVLADRDPDQVGAHLRTLLDLPADDAGSVFDADGFGELPLSGLGALPLHFDRSSGRLHALAGMSPSREQLGRLLDEIGTGGPRSHALHTLEGEIDAGGQGLLVWLDVRAFRPWLAMGSAAMGADYGETVQTLAFGWGSVNGHGRLSVRAEVDNPSWLRYLPRAPRRLDVTSAGQPGFVIALAIPTVDELTSILAAIDEDFDAGATAAWQELNELVEKATDLSLNDWLAPFGPELAVFNDDAGFFSAIRIRDRAAFERVLEAAMKFDGERRSRRIAGQEIHHLRYRPPQPVDFTDAAAGAGMGALATLGWWQNLPQHVYWIEADGWMISSHVPQPLIDRALVGTDTRLEQWLQAELGDDRNQSLLTASTRLRDLPRWYYHVHLSLLASLGDIAGTPIDLFDLPSARQLELPRETAIGLAVIANESRIAIDLNYELTAFDGLLSFGGGYASIAAAGVLAAIAIPAYQDYGSRSTVAQAVAAAAPLRVAISEHFVTQGQLPQARDLIDLLEAQPSSLPAQILFEAGAIRIRFTVEAAAGLANTDLYLRPARTRHGELVFVCGHAGLPSDATELLDGLDADATTVPAKQLPAHCRH